MAVDIKYVNPFLKATVTVFEMLGLPGGRPGKVSISDLTFPVDTFLIQVGVTGGMRGQVFIAFADDRAKAVASVMMMGMPVNELDEMACSALGELGNMILGNTATIFSTQNIIFDITPPMLLHGKGLKLQSDIPAIAIPVVIQDCHYATLYVCVEEAK